MKDTMKRFLKSIGIENIDAFDLDFDMVGRSKFGQKTVQMAIVKNSPWDYYLLNQFQEGLRNIPYSYTMHFSYKKRPSGYDALSLFDEWYQSIYHIPHNLIVSADTNSILIEYVSEDEKGQYEQTIIDFQDFLSFYGYDIFINSTITPQEQQGERSSDEEIEQLTAEAVKVIQDDDPNNDEDDVQDRGELAALEKERLEAKYEVESSVLKQMRENKKKMKEERKKTEYVGNFTFIGSIQEIDSNSGYVDFCAKVFSIDVRTFGSMTTYTFGVSDSEHAINVKATTKRSTISLETLNAIVLKTNMRIRGKVAFDNYRNEIYVFADYLDLLPPDPLRKDKEENKRVELHLHTHMSALDAVGDLPDYVALAKNMGHKAIGLTDHGVVQSFPQAQELQEKNKIKILYGSELYMVDDSLKFIFNPSNVLLTKATYVVLDLETTGLSSRYDAITEFGAVKFEGGLVRSRLDILINPERKIPEKIVKKTNITDEMVKDKPTFAKAIDQILDYIGDAIIVTHNAQFDVGFLNESLRKINRSPLTNPVIDTLPLSYYLFPSAGRHNLGALCRNFDVVYDDSSAHRGDYDASVLNEVWQAMLVVLTKDNLMLKHEDLAKLQTSDESLKHMMPRHVVAFAKNLEGIKDLFKLISLSHIQFFSGVPRIPRKELIKLRSNLLLGSACFNGEIFETAKTRSKQELIEKMKFYDYIEVQPPENYSYLVGMGEVSSMDSIKRLLKDIIEAAKEAGKMVVATGDVHYVNPEDKKYRDIYIYAKGLGNVNHPLCPYQRESMPPFENPDQHYRSTREMLDAFSFLDEKLAYEIVVTNTNIIADSLDEMAPVKTKLYPPKIENSEVLLKDLCYKTAHEYYGDPLPQIIEDRLKRELDGIIGNGYSVTYYIANRIIEHANEDGYIVGSRGSVGSSFVATMSGITEVNPLPPHYRCPKCKHLEFIQDKDIRSGFDLPNKVCPICGTKMIADGQNIPFETFLGFNADKVPDIDLNFPADYQSKAHAYTKVLLGASNVFRAGTIGSVKLDSAFGYVKGYYKRINKPEPSSADKSMLASGCIGVKRTTGQHPGGIVVVPSDYDVYDFTPIQYPADDKEADWQTTHFDFSSMHDTLLKLDLLGHVDPMALKMMGELTHIDPSSIPLNDPQVISLFSSDKALKRSSNYLKESTGALGLPEFGTNFVRGILKEARPKSFADLLVISGLSHGKGVWQGNAQDLLKSKTALSLKSVIGCRDDIMTYLLSMGVPPKMSFSIMEDVRKGRGVKKEFEEVMIAHGVPQYYIDSCNKIMYMFPKAHATAYVTMALRVGYFKVYYPLEFYATFFSVRSDQYDIETMLKGKEATIDKLEEFKRRKANKEALSNKEDAVEQTLEMCMEMFERGFSFSNINLYRSEAGHFVVDYETKTLIPPFDVIDGLGLAAAESVVEARQNGEFLSKEDLLARTKLNNTCVEVLSKLGVLKGLNETNQINLFDFSF